MKLRGIHYCFKIVAIISYHFTVTVGAETSPFFWSVYINAALCEVCASTICVSLCTFLTFYKVNTASPTSFYLVLN